MTKKVSLVAVIGGPVADYQLDGRLFMCHEFVKHVYGSTPKKIRITASLTPDPKAKRIVIHPGYKNWGWNSKQTSRKCAGMYSEMARQLYLKLGVNANGTEPIWFDAPTIPPITEPVSIYVRITRV